MITTLVSSLVLAMLAQAEPPVSAFVFHDQTAHDGRRLLAFRRVELADQPATLITFAGGAELAGMAYGLLPVGGGLDSRLAVAWSPTEPNGPTVFFDGNGDGRFAKEERHVLRAQSLEVAAMIAVDTPAGRRRLRRTVVLRRGALGDGLRYAVRGYRSGSLRLGETDYRALLTDGNADGLFNSVGTDRVWIDLNADGRFQRWSAPSGGCDAALCFIDAGPTIAGPPPELAEEFGVAETFGFRSKPSSNHHRATLPFKGEECQSRDAGPLLSPIVLIGSSRWLGLVIQVCKHRSVVREFSRSAFMGIVPRVGLGRGACRSHGGECASCRAALSFARVRLSCRGR